LIFVAGDLSDPHGTHRMCKEAIDRALRELGSAKRAKGSAPESPEGKEGAPEVWLYRGAWQEWPIHEATWLVPLSQEELRLKIQAIFKHQSQKDSAPFPGAMTTRVLAARRSAQQGHGRRARSARAGRVLRDGSYVVIVVSERSEDLCPW
jgi:LmbE family N-acetylglucosaminyl deacetylase